MSDFFHFSTTFLSFFVFFASKSHFFAFQAKRPSAAQIFARRTDGAAFLSPDNGGTEGGVKTIETRTVLAHVMVSRGRGRALEKCSNEWGEGERVTISLKIVTCHFAVCFVTFRTANRHFPQPNWPFSSSNPRFFSLSFSLTGVQENGCLRFVTYRSALKYLRFSSFIKPVFEKSIRKICSREKELC